LSKNISPDRYSIFSILPIPYEKTTTFQKGTKNGPKAIINSFKYIEMYDIEEDIENHFKNINILKPLKLPVNNPKSAMKIIENKITVLLNDNKLPIILGGEHTISAGTVPAFYNKFKKKLSILHFDAHADLRESYLGSKFNHACALKRMRDYCKNTVSIGIRSMDISEKKLIKKENILIFDDYYIHKNGVPIKKINNNLTKNVFISIDVDVLSPSLLPDTGTPEPGGFGWYDLINILKSIIKEKNIVGIEVVELRPSKYSAASSYIIAKIIYKIITYIVKHNMDTL